MADKPKNTSPVSPPTASQEKPMDAKGRPVLSANHSQDADRHGKLRHPQSKK